MTDLRYALRLLARQPAFATLATLTMALGIGAMTTLFSVMYGVLLKPLPWVEPERLVRLTETHAGATRSMPLMMTNMAYVPWSDTPQTVEAMGAWQKSVMTLTGAGDTTRVTTALLTPSVFSMLEAAPVVGSPFSSADAHEVVLSYGFWQERFGGDAAAVGRSLQINGIPYAIVGVMPREFFFPDPDTRLWLPLAIAPVIGPNGTQSISMFSAMARLKRGVTPAQAGAEATARARVSKEGGRVALAIFGSNGEATVTAVPVLDALTHDIKPGLAALFLAVSLLLLTAIANVVSLQLARATTRHREMAIRSALGAATSRLVQQLLVENVVLAFIGGAAGLGFSVALHRALPSLLPADFPRLHDIAFSQIVVWFALAMTTITGMLLGLLPALHVRRLRLVDALTENAGGSVGGTRLRGRTAIMVGQVAMASTLLIGGTLLVRSFEAMRTRDRGFTAEHVLTARLNLPDFAFTPAARLETLATLVDRAHALPGVASVALTTGLPLSGSENLTAFDMPSVRPPAGASISVHAVRSVITPEYFAALRMRLAHGRAFRAEDDAASAPRVVMVNRMFARQYLTDTPIGDRIRNFMQGDGVDFEVIGVVEDVMRGGLQDATQPEIYSLLHQSLRPSANQDVVVRTTGDPVLLVPQLRALVRQLAPSGTLDSVRTMDDRIATSLARPRLYAVLLTVFACAALAIASVGLFGVLSYTVAQRTREIALRYALGARPSRIFTLVFRYGLAVTLTGLVAGMAAAIIATRFFTSLLYGVSTFDAVTLTIVSTLMLVVAIAACLVPALRAVRIDPISALRT